MSSSVAYDAATNYAAVVLLVMMGCLRDAHATGESPSIITYPVMLLRETGQLAKSASL
jgi:hypothetical protein